MNSSKENIVYISKYIPSQPILCTKIRVLVLGFSKVLLLIFYPLFIQCLRWEPPWHSLMKIPIPKTKPFFGIGEGLGFSSKSAPTSPSYQPFGQHLRIRCSLTRSSYGGVAGHRCLQPRGYQVDPIQNQYNSYISSTSSYLLRKNIY